MERFRDALRAAGAFALLLVLAGTARAGGIDLLSVDVKGKGVEDGITPVTVVVKGNLADPGPLDGADSLVFQLGAVTDTRRGTVLGSKGKYQSGTVILPNGTSKISFKINPLTGAFQVKGKKLQVGALGEQIPFTVRFGDRAMTALLDLPPFGRKVGYRPGQALKVRLTGRVIGAGSSRGRSSLTPLPSAPLFVENDTEQPSVGVTVTDSSQTTDGVGGFWALLETTDPGNLDGMDPVNLSAVVGSADGSTTAGNASTTVGQDGEVSVVAFVQREVSGTATVDPAGDTLEVDRQGGKRSGKLVFAAGAVGTTVAGVSFTPYQLPTEMPAPLPSGYVPVAAADIDAPSGTSVAASLVTVELERPEWVKKRALENKSLTMFQYRGGAWTATPGRGMHDPSTDRIVPDPAAPCSLLAGAPGPVAYAIQKAGSSRIRGRIRRNGGAGVKKAPVFTAAGAAVTGGDGEFEVPVSAVDAADIQSLQVVDADIGVSRALDPSQAGSEVTVDLSAAPAISWSLQTISGRVLQADGNPAPGAKVTVRLSSAVTGLSYDDGRTPEEAVDDTFSLPDLSALGVESAQWTIYIPGVSAALTRYDSTGFTGRTAEPYAILQEAEAAGRTLPDGTYTVRALASLPGVGNLETWGGFRKTTSGGDIQIAEIQLPTPYEGANPKEATTQGTGTFTMSYRAPGGAPLEIQAEGTDGSSTAPVTFSVEDMSALQTLRLGASGSLPAGFQFVGGTVVCVQDGAAMALVPEGEFIMGGSAESSADPAHPVFLPGFLIDRSEVTVAQFKAFVAANPSFTLPTQPAGSTDAHPVVGVTYSEATYYAAWAGKRLPTEAEWERAARGTDPSYLYPWGAADDPARRNQNGTEPVAASSYDSGTADGRSPTGCLNMSGNLAEMCSDWYDAAYYLITPYLSPSGPETGTARVLRGGAWNGVAADLKVTARRTFVPYQRRQEVGFRCAASLR